MEDRHLVTTGKLQSAGEQRRRGEGAGWIMRVVKHHQPGLVSHLPGRSLKSGRKWFSALSGRRHKTRPGTERRRAVNRIAGIGGDQILTGAEQRPRDAANADMRTLKHGDFCCADRVPHHIAGDRTGRSPRVPVVCPRTTGSHGFHDDEWRSAASQSLPAEWVDPDCRWKDRSAVALRC